MLIQFSPIRSGSTLVYNILMKLGKSPHKRHCYAFNKNNHYVITIRHPYNSIISSILRYEKEINIQNVKSQMNEYIRNGGGCISNSNFDDKKHCALYYEKFNNNFDDIFEKFELFFDEKYPSELKDKIKKELSIENVKELTKKYKNFWEYDGKTHLHGKHISIYNGQTDYREILSDDQLELLEKNATLQKIIEKYYNV